MSEMTTDTPLLPKSADDAAQAVSWALANNQPLEIIGTGSKRALGRPVQAAHTLSLAALNGIVAYEPEELVLTAQAGTPMSAILAALAARNQQLAFEPADLGPLLGRAAGEGTLGGVLSAGLAGPRRIKAGAARDHLLGFQGVNGRGELYRGGGKVVKNVTGYDLPKIMAGAFGTLTVLTEVTVKVLPAPETTQTLVMAGRDLSAALALMTRAMQSPYEVSGAAHLPADIAARSAVGAVAGLGNAATLVRLEGFSPSVVARVAVLKDELGADLVLDDAASLALWREVADVGYFAAEQNRLVWKISVPPSDAPKVAEALTTTLGADVFFDWAGGLIWAALAPQAGDDGAVRACLPGSGHATLIRAPQALRQSAAVFQPLPDGLMALSRSVKASFDPQGLFNPGRLYAGL